MQELSFSSWPEAHNTFGPLLGTLNSVPPQLALISGHFLLCGHSYPDHKTAFSNHPPAQTQAVRPFSSVRSPQPQSPDDHPGFCFPLNASEERTLRSSVTGTCVDDSGQGEPWKKGAPEILDLSLPPIHLRWSPDPSLSLSSFLL